MTSTLGNQMESTAPLARTLGEFIARTRYASLPAQAVKIAKNAFIDTVGVIVAGCNEPPVRVLHKTLGADTNGEAALFFGKARAWAPHAAWLNGAAGHVLDYDDFARGHPSVVLVPAILAEGEALDASGADIVNAYVVGYEVWMDLVMRERGSYQTKGSHPTSLIAPLAAAAACAKLRRLNADQAASALGLAAHQASGLTIGHGTMAKSFQVGKAAYTGVISARLAQNGMSTSLQALDHNQGFLRAVSPTGDVDIASASRLGEDWRIINHGPNLKCYPVCYRVHRVVDATLEVAKGRSPDPRDVQKVEVLLGKIDAMILANHEPATGLAAKFSAEFAVAACLLAKRITLAELTDEFVGRPEVQQLMRRVTVITNENYDPEAPGFSMYDQVRVHLRHGQVIESAQVRHAPGSVKRPIIAEALATKFLECLRFGNPELDAARMLDALKRLDALKSCRELTHEITADV